MVKLAGRVKGTNLGTLNSELNANFKIRPGYFFFSFFN